MKIKFHGAAGMVTGSNFLIEMKNYKILVDCGMFQGNKLMENKNYEDFPYDPGEIDYLILTHAHIDHSGRIPKLVKEGFRGRIFATSASYDLCKIMLLDSANIQESDVRWENKRRQRAGKTALEPLYTVEDAENSLKYFEPYFYDQMIKINDEVSLRFKDAGHILGSAIVELWLRDNSDQVKLVFTGDLGVAGRPIIKDPDIIDEADYLIVESTYGDRVHESSSQSTEALIDIIEKTALRGGTVIIPAFAVGRTQDIIYKLNAYYEYADIEEHMRIPVYVDSPMAIEATKTFEENSGSFNKDTRNLILSGDNPFQFENLRYVMTQEESIALNKMNFPKVIISASGMATAGRVRHHLKHNLWNKNNTLLFVGYQAEGTLGRILLDGAKRVKLLGEYLDVNLEVKELQGFSGHADKNDIIDWISKMKKKPKNIFVVHGEEEAQKSLAGEIEKTFGIRPMIPKLGDEYLIKKSHMELDEKGQEFNEVLREDIELELERVTLQLQALLEKQDELFDPEHLNKDYDIIKNGLISLQHSLMDLNMKVGK